MDKKNNTYEACEELVKIIKDNYVSNCQFKSELVAILIQKGGEKLGRLCNEVINCLEIKL